jgi:2-iminobutanoate/2-iminopropanoate deaminase
MNNSLKKVETEKAPQAIGPYSQAVAAGEYLFVSGQIPINPVTGKLVEGGVEKQAGQVLDNVEAILKAFGIGFDRVVKSEVYLKDIGDFGAVNDVYASRFSHEIKPARQAMQVAKLPMDASVEISCIAYTGR